MINHSMFPDVLVNTEGEIGLTSKKTDWVITQADQTGEIKITLNNRDCYEAYTQSKAFGINVDPVWWKFWTPTPVVTCSDDRLSKQSDFDWDDY